MGSNKWYADDSNELDDLLTSWSIRPLNFYECLSESISDVSTLEGKQLHLATMNAWLSEFVPHIQVVDVKADGKERFAWKFANMDDNDR